MGIISIRLNQQEERVLNKLSDYYEEDRSKLLKKSLYEMYENIIDRNIIEIYEKKEKNSKTRFHAAEDILKKL